MATYLQVIGLVVMLLGVGSFGFGVQLEHSKKDKTVTVPQNLSVPDMDNGAYTVEITTDYVFLVKDGETKRRYKKEI